MLNVPVFTQAPISFGGAGDNTIVAGVAGKIIKVYRLVLIVGAATNITLKDGANVLTGPLTLSANGGLVMDANVAIGPAIVISIPWWVTGLGNGFVINSSVGVQVSGMLDYLQG